MILKDHLPGLVLVKFYMKPIIGDIVLTNNGEVVISDENKDSFLQIVEVTVSLQALDINSAYVIYKDIKNINTIISSHKHDAIDQLAKYCAIKIDPNSITVNDLDQQI
jgi:hypothetical protein